MRTFGAWTILGTYKVSQYYNQEINYMYKSSYFLVLNSSHVKDASDQIPLQKKLENGDTELRYIRTNLS